MTADIEISNIGQTEVWCMKYIGPRLFYIHNQIGGPGWTILKQGSKAVLRVEDRNQYLLALLQFGK
jgi:hypothetical protein